MEIKEEAEVKLERGNELADCRTRKADFSETFEDSDLAGCVKCCEEMAGVLPDARIGHPTSMLGVQCDGRNDQPARFSRAKQEVPDSVAELDSEEPDEDYGASDVDTMERRRSVDLEKSEDKPGRTQTASADGEFRNVSNEALDTDKWSRERQRPTRAAGRLTRLRYRYLHPPRRKRQ